MSYTTVLVTLTNGQIEKLAKSYKKSAPITLRLSAKSTTGNKKLIVTQTQANRLKKARINGTGLDIKVSQTGIRKQSGAGRLTA